MKITGRLVDILNRKIFPAQISFDDGKISNIVPVDSDEGSYILPGFVDSHIHIESSMVTPGSFAKAAVSRGTVAVVSDPHEIANVLGIDGILFMIEDSKKVPLKFYFGAPSCVPATDFESSGFRINSVDIKKLLEMPEINYLAEMMNYPGVIYNDQEVGRKLEIARRLNKPVDGHAPGLTGENLRKYISAGISTDHECTTAEEAREKIGLGMKILIREGSAAKNLHSLKELYRTNPDMLMLCSDDLHPEMLVKQHINVLVAKLISEGFDLFDVLKSCTINPAIHYNINTGYLQQGKPADFILVDDLRTMNVKTTFINGQKVFENGKTLFHYNKSTPVNNFNSSTISATDIQVITSGKKIRVIEAFDGSLVTKENVVNIPSGQNAGQGDYAEIQKIVVKDRYKDLPPAVGFIRGFGLRTGAFASSVAHDSHNIICTGTNDEDIAAAVNEIVKLQGGLAVVNGPHSETLPLPVAGIISDKPVDEVAARYEQLSEMVKSNGCKLSAPFMTLSFMALLVIPELKISDSGLFDGRTFRPVDLFA